MAPLGLPPWQETIERMRSILHRWHGDRTMVRPAVAPTIPLHCRDEFMVACRDLAAEFDVGIHTHLAESKIQAVVGARRYGRSLTTHIEQLGLLGPRFVAAHGVWLDGDDMRRLGAHGASIAHNPASNMRLGNGVADAVGMLEAGVNLAIGTDATTCNDNLNMYQSLHFAAAASHARGPDPARWITAPQVFAAATTGSARALGFERIGRIAPGYAADIVFLDLDAPTLIPLNEPTTQMVMGEDGTSVVDVMVGGRFVVRGPTAADGRSAGIGGARGGTARRDRCAQRGEPNALRCDRADSQRFLSGTGSDRVAHQPLVWLRVRAGVMGFASLYPSYGLNQSPHVGWVERSETHRFGYPRIPIATGRLVMSIRASIHSTNFAVG